MDKQRRADIFCARWPKTKVLRELDGATRNEGLPGVGGGGVQQTLGQDTLAILAN